MPNKVVLHFGKSTIYCFWQIFLARYRQYKVQKWRRLGLLKTSRAAWNVQNHKQTQIKMYRKQLLQMFSDIIVDSHIFKWILIEMKNIFIRITFIGGQLTKKSKLSLNEWLSAQHFFFLFFFGTTYFLLTLPTYRPDWKNVPRLSDKLTPLGIMGSQLRFIIKLLSIIVPQFSRGFNLDPLRDAHSVGPTIWTHWPLYYYIYNSSLAYICEHVYVLAKLSFHKTWV